MVLLSFSIPFRFLCFLPSFVFSVLFLFVFCPFFFSSFFFFLFSFFAFFDSLSFFSSFPFLFSLSLYFFPFSFFPFSYSLFSKDAFLLVLFKQNGIVETFSSKMDQYCKWVTEVRENKAELKRKKRKRKILFVVKVFLFSC